MGMSPRLLRPKQTLDADALRYILAVQSADGQPLESSVATAINSFVVGCKRDNIWSAIKAGCILCGARTLAGALVPLRGGDVDGTECWSVVTPTITNVSGSSGQWNASTLTMSNTVVGTNAGYPRFKFTLPGVNFGSTYRVSGRLTGDISRITTMRLTDGGTLADISYNSSTGVFSATNLVAGAGSPGTFAGIEIHLNGTSVCSVSIASISIVETFPVATNVNFVQGDYNRKTGLVGNGSSKYLNTNRGRYGDGQDDSHAAVFSSAAPTGNSARSIGVGDSTGLSAITRGSSSTECVVSHGSTTETTITSELLNFLGISRSSASSHTYRINGTAGTASIASQTRTKLNWYLFNRNPLSTYSNGRLAFYSVGSSLNLATLDTRVSDLISAIQAAIP